MTADTRDDLGRLLLLDPEAVEAIPWETREDRKGVLHKVLWRSGDVVVGLMKFEPGSEDPGHVHHAAHHHLFVLAGSATIAGKPLTAGSYAYIPPGTFHATTDVGPDGCTLFYTYRPLEARTRAEDIGVSSYV